LFREVLLPSFLLFRVFRGLILSMQQRRRNHGARRTRRLSSCSVYSVVGSWISQRRPNHGARRTRKNKKNTRNTRKKKISNLSI